MDDWPRVGINNTMRNRKYFDIKLGDISDYIFNDIKYFESLSLVKDEKYVPWRENREVILEKTQERIHLEIFGFTPDYYTIYQDTEKNLYLIISHYRIYKDSTNILKLKILSSEWD